MSVQQTLEGTLPGPITEFRGDYRFLSNFYVLVPIHLGAPWWTPEVARGGWKSVEHAYQAAKVEPGSERFAEHYRRIWEADQPGEAKRLGQAAAFTQHGVTLRSGWDQIQVPVMLAALRAKFDPAADGGVGELAHQLVQTSPRVLIEGNTWGDTYWGVCNGRGRNMLGRCLMLVRQELNVAFAARLPVEEVRGG